MENQAVKVLACSTACIPEGLAEELGICVIPMNLVIDGRTYRDGIDITAETFYGSAMYENPCISTSAPTAGSYIEAFESFAEAHDSVLCITIARGMSASYQAAATAAEKVSSIRVEVMDSENAASALAQVVLAAARKAGEGASHEEVAGRAREVAQRVRLLATVDTLEYLRKSGRVRRTAAFAADALNIKPILHIESGELEPFAKTRSRRRALDRIIEEAVDEYAEKGPLRLAVFHAAAPDEALELKERIEASVEYVESLLTYFTPVMGWATGPGLIGASFHAD